MTLVIVHGFLGQPTDFASLIEKIKKNKSDLEIETINLWQDHGFTPNVSIDRWARNFIEKYNNQKVIGLGYSLGGRLLAHAFIKNPILFDKLFLVSSNPFQMKSSELPARIKHNQFWSDKVSNSNWDEFIKAWNEQNIFCGKKETFIRLEGDFTKELLAKSLVDWGPNTQVHPYEVFKNIKNKNIFWITGELDTKYTKILLNVKKVNSDHNFKIFPNIGHRVPWEEDSFNNYILENL